MPAIITTKFRVHNAEQFKEAFSETANNKMYLFIGRPQAFADDNSPPTPVDTTQSTDYHAWYDMLAAKRITSTDVSHAIRRYDWTSGTTYTQYDNTADLVNEQFYVYTDDDNIYKVIGNANSATSTVKPTGTSNLVFETSDGYKWKYMYSVGAGDAIKFQTTSFIPASVLTSDDGSSQYDVQSTAVDGEINNIIISSAGSNYASAPTVTITGDGEGATATASISGNTLNAITITNGGNGYTNATVTLTGGNTTSSVAAARALVSPKGGHGSNPIEELHGFFVVMNARLDGSESSNTFTVANDFRKVGVVRDPTTYGTSDVATATAYRQTYRYTVSGVSGTPAADETITFSGGATGIVVEYDSGGPYVYVTNQPNEVANTETFTTTGGASGTVDSSDNPGLNPYSGDVIYLENRAPINRAADQLEDIKLIIEF